VVQSDKG